MSIKRKSVFCAISGGVDSAVSAALLKRKGFDVTGVFIKVWYPEFAPCDWKNEQRDAMRVAAVLDIPFLTFDCEEVYKKEVVDYMLSEYEKGRTPNPDVMCNKYIKFGSFLEQAKKRGADYIATGHYARRDMVSNGDEKLYLLRESKDKKKDQSYFLWTLGQGELACSLFPVGNITKKEVRKLALRFNIPVAGKKDSQGLCFLGKIDMQEFLRKYLPEKGGDLLDTKGNIIGTHNGAYFFTIGQRHGFTVFKKGTDDVPLYAVSKNIEKNTVTVSEREEKDNSCKTGKLSKVFLSQENWISKFPFSGEKYLARIRYHQVPQLVTFLSTKDGAYVEFDTPQEGLSFGQSLVLYSKDVCLGGGIMEKALLDTNLR
ncbi:MAG: tRNA 2-thiouridine(34) synthase MnmA [Candidatus Pacebacteria bacterium]|nr:tRNA 2-thiouridine(34) synthase MnmA [Candidatus Paceibacterota bacterium]